MRVKRMPMLYALALAAAIIVAPGASGQHAEAVRVAAEPASNPATTRLNGSDKEIADYFDNHISRTVERLELPGAAVIVVRDGRTILAKGYGHSDIASKRPIDVERSLFRAASISKLVPWVLAMQLVEEGRLDLDRDVNAYLDFEIPKRFGRPTTMRHLMTHSAGFPERFHGAFDQDLSRSLGQVLRTNVPQQVYPPGSTVAYSNYGAALAGYIVERLRGAPWDQVVARHFFQPLRMANSTVAQPVPESMRAFLTSTYLHGETAPAEFRTTPLAPMGALTASPADMGRLLKALQSGGAGENGRILSPPTIERMMTLDKPLGPGLRAGLGLGFMVGEHRGVRYAGHGGNMSTVATDLELLPDHGLGWYYVFNSQGPGEQARSVGRELVLATIERFVAPVGPAVRAAAQSSALDVEGSYLSTRRIFSGPLMFSGLFNTTVVSAKPDGSLMISTGGATTRWLPSGRDRFVEEKTGTPLAVTRGTDGKVQRIASALLYPVAEFERAPMLTAVAPLLAAFAFGTLFLTLLGKPVAWAIARRRRRRAGAVDGSGASSVPGTADRVKRWARISYWLLMATIFAWIAFAIALAVDFTILFSLPGVIRIALGIMTALSAVFAALLVADAILSWRDDGRGLGGRLAAAIAAAGAIAAMLLFYALDVVNFSANW